MIKLILTTISAAFIAAFAAADEDDVFPANLTSWTKVQDIENTGVTQWSIVFEDGRGVGRLDLLHTSGPEAVTYFLARRPCAGGTTAWGRIPVGYKLNDIGKNCEGDFPYPPVVASWQQYRDTLPVEAKDLLK